MSILSAIGTYLAGIGYMIISFFGNGTVPAALPALIHHDTVEVATTSVEVPTASNAAAHAPLGTSNPNSIGPKAYTQDELLAMAGDDYANGTVPLGDHKYVTTGPKKGYIYLCHANINGNAGAGVDGPWIGQTTWNFKQKTQVSGSVSWPNATFSDLVQGATRVITGNDEPLTHTTGIYPIQSSDAAYQYDRNPNSIKAQNLKYSLPADPTYSDTPYCMGGEVGIMLTGVPLFNGFDEPLRDAPAHELQDSCSGHPQVSGEYHYHSLSSCMKDTSITTVLGYALDGFPITGPVVTPGKYLTTNDLDECHGLTSEIIENGKKVTTYHYVMTYDFPYSASCFRGKPSTTGPSGGMGGQNPGSQASQGTGTQQGGMQGGTPPQAAIDACSGKTAGATCSFTGGRGETVSGTCGTPPGSSLACMPAR
jgi:hypothetical protein